MKYYLNLADGTKCSFASTAPEIEKWLDLYSTILQLERGKSEARMKLDFQLLERLESKKNTKYKNHGKIIFDDKHFCKIFSDKSLSKIKILISPPALYLHHVKYNLMNYSLYPVFLKTLERGGSPLHAALVEYNGAGILIAAAGGTGKTTCCRRIPKNWTPLCDDAALLVKTGMGISVHPLPTWSDFIIRKLRKKWDTGKHLPLSAVFFLKQSKTDKVIELNPAETAVKLYNSSKQILGVFWTRLPEIERKKYSLKTFHAISEISKNVRGFTLKASIDGAFWKKMEEVLKTNRISG